MTEENTSLATGAKLTKETFDNFIERLKFQNRGDGTKDHCTAHPLFLIQKRVLTYGFTEEYSDRRVIVCDEVEWFSPEDYWNDADDNKKELINAIVKEADDCEFTDLSEDDQWTLLSELDDHSLIFYKEDWEYVNAHFTPEAANAFIERKKHDYPKGLRVYVDSQYWAWEFKTIVEALINGKLVLKND